MQKFIDNTKTYLSTDNTEVIYEAGKAVGLFQIELLGQIEINENKLREVVEKYGF